MIDGKELMRRREAAKLSQKDLGEMIGVTRNAINRMEAETMDPSLAVAATIAHVLGCRVDDLLLCRENKPKGKRVSKEVPAS